MVIITEITENEHVNERHPLSKSTIWLTLCDNGKTARDKIQYRKSHSGFRLVPKSANINDAERCNDGRPAPSLL